MQYALTGISLNTDLRQTTKLSPAQIQVIRMLEIPAVELRQRVEEEIQENPLLEEVPEWEKPERDEQHEQDAYEDDYLYADEPQETDDYDAFGRTVLHIEPGVSFGTGTHETTRLCLGAIERHMDGCRTFLDVGCGSGILSVAALLLGAERAEAVDIDPLAVKMAKLNGELNGFAEPKYTVLEGNLTDKVHGTFDVVAANIVADAILLLSKDIKQFMNPGALYITSGIIDLREAEVLDAFDRFGFEVLERYEEGGWLCFVTKAK